MNHLIAFASDENWGSETELLALIVFYALLAILPLVLIGWGLLGFRKKHEKHRQRRVVILVIGMVLFLLPYWYSL